MGFGDSVCWDLKNEFAGICGIKLGQNLGIDKVVREAKVNMKKNEHIQVFLYILKFLKVLKF